MKRVAVLAAPLWFALASRAWADPMFRIGSTARTDVGAVACKSTSDVDRLIELAGAHDKQAFAAFAFQHGCSVIDRGTTGVVEDVSVWHGQYCFRPTGQPDCLWTPKGFLKAAK